jgi:hypothetical protein
MSDEPRRRGRPSLHHNGGSALVRRPHEAGDELQGCWSRERLMRMEARFVDAISRCSDARIGEEKTFEGISLRIACGTNRRGDLLATSHFQYFQL